MMKSVCNHSAPDNANIRLRGWCGGSPRPQASGDQLLPYFEPPPALPRTADRSIEDLRYGKPENVFKPDNRVRIMNPTAYPFSAVCGLTILNKQGERYFGTGFLAGPKLVLTAGHNVFYHSDGGFMDKIHVFPGLNGDRRQPPIGSVVSTRFATVEAWQIDASSQFDFGAIFLDHDMSQAAGFLSVSKFTTEFLHGLTLTLTGYPKDPPENSGFPNDGSIQWRDSGRANVEANRLTHTIDSSIGQSGSPLIAFFPDKNEYHAVGIHNTAFVSDNAATRINDEVFAQIVQWRQQSDAS